MSVQSAPGETGINGLFFVGEVSVEHTAWKGGRGETFFCGLNPPEGEKNQSRFFL